MSKNPSENRLLVWSDEYSVKVKEIDDQHKQLFEIINDLMRAINNTPNEDNIKGIITKTLTYKNAHFATEEKYFDLYNFEGAEEHKAMHREFNLRIDEIQSKHQGDTITFTFELVDFLEDWLITHLMGMDQKYVKCFNEHGLH